jgi:adenylosuccinate synthase
MAARIVVGGNWGDEGKGRMVDYFAKDADCVVRYQGGHNAGHTVVNDRGKFALRLVPSGIFYPGVVNIVGPGTVVNLEALADEIQNLSGKGVHIGPENLKVSDRACICFPFHKLQDQYEEQRLGKEKFGSTVQGIAPVYGDRYMKYGVQVGALRHPDYLRDQLRRTLELKNSLFERVYGQAPVSLDDMCDWATLHGKRLLPHVCDTVDYLEAAARANKTILLEAQLGSLRDIFYGIYPYTTSSSPLAAFAAVGAGLFVHTTTTVTAVVKAFSTCVGEGPFVTEIHGEAADKFRNRTGEFGAATGRPRRIGHFDALATRYGVRIQGATEVALTKLDNLSGEGPLKICTHYEINGRRIDHFPLVPELRMAKPVYKEMDGWSDDIASARRFDDLPEAACRYVETIEELIRVPVRFVSVGAEREALMIRQP